MKCDFTANQCDDRKKKKFRLLAESHYMEASKLFVHLESALELLRVQLERVALCEYQLASKMFSGVNCLRHK